jgi:hypothetical protein
MDSSIVGERSPFTSDGWELNPILVSGWTVVIRFDPPSDEEMARIEKLASSHRCLLYWRGVDKKDDGIIHVESILPENGQLRRRMWDLLVNPMLVEIHSENFCLFKPSTNEYQIIFGDREKIESVLTGSVEETMRDFTSYWEGNSDAEAIFFKNLKTTYCDS